MGQSYYSVLVVWSSVDEEPIFVDFPKIDLDTKNLLLSFHNVYIGSGENPDIETQIEEFFFKDGYFKENFGVLPKEDRYFDLIILTGQVL